MEGIQQTVRTVARTGPPGLADYGLHKLSSATANMDSLDHLGRDGAILVCA